ncbi:MAG: hypothetical protein IJ397_04805 [Lachnospiraceae bacterium]|nr:hypothetical protein [Lachnospiraceae bacterium]
MRKWSGIILAIGIALCMTACGSSATVSSAVSPIEVSVVCLGQEGQTVLQQALEFQSLLPKDQLTVSAIRHIETTLPEVIIDEGFSDDIEIVTYCNGDIGNDGSDNIAVIFRNSYYRYGEDAYIVAVFEEAESGVYRCLEYSEALFLKCEEEDASPDYLYDVRIEDGMFKVSNDMYTNEFMHYGSVWILEEDALILDEVTVSRMSLLTGNGVETTYKMQEGTAVCAATSLWNRNVAGRVIYDATFAPERITMKTVDQEYIPTMFVMYCTYAEGGRTYDYRSLGITDEMLEDFPKEDKWKIAYIHLLDELILTDEYIDESRFSLLYIDEDDIPELVYGVDGHWISTYTYAPGKESLGVKDVATVMDRWPYGAFGNIGYQYLPGENVLYNHDSDYAGAVRYSSFFKIGSNKEIENMYYLKTVIYDEDGNVSANGESGRSEYFYNGEREISEEAFLKYKIDGDYDYIEGNYYGHKIITELCGDCAWTEPVWKEAYRVVIETVTKEHAESETAVYELTYDLIYLNSDNIPELVIGQPKGESWVSVYSCTLGRYAEGVENVALLVDAWKYNYGCNYGYHYAPGTGRIQEYVELHGNGYYFLDHYMRSYGTLYTGRMFLCEMEFISEAEGYQMTYYRGDELFTQERWDYFMDERLALDWEFLEGTQTYDEIMTGLES